MKTATVAQLIEIITKNHHTIPTQLAKSIKISPKNTKRHAVVESYKDFDVLGVV